MIARVMAQASAARTVTRVIVATDDERIAAAVSRAGGEAWITAKQHQSGSDRVAEVAAMLRDAEIIVNVQGDEPLISPVTIDRAVRALVDDQHADMATAWEPVSNAADVLNPDVVKLVMNAEGRVLYFSRAPVPFPRDAVRRAGTLATALENEPALLASFRKHAGLYVYRRPFLLEYTSWPPAEIELAESLEQLRAVAHGAIIRAVPAETPSISVDTPDDLARVRACFEAPRE